MNKSMNILLNKELTFIVSFVW